MHQHMRADSVQANTPVTSHVCVLIASMQVTVSMTVRASMSAVATATTPTRSHASCCDTLVVVVVVVVVVVGVDGCSLTNSAACSSPHDSTRAARFNTTTRLSSHSSARSRDTMCAVSVDNVMHTCAHATRHNAHSGSLSLTSASSACTSPSRGATTNATTTLCSATRKSNTAYAHTWVLHAHALCANGGTHRMPAS
jgi:hypothetical protein